MATTTGHEIEGLGDVEGLASPKAKAEVLATKIREEVRSGTAEPLGAHVEYEDHPGPDKGKTAWVSSATLNKNGKGNCNSTTVAAAHGVEQADGTVVKTDPSHVAVVDVPQAPGKPPVQHAFLIASPKPGDKPLDVDGDGKVVGDLPMDRVIDVNVAKGANGGRPLPKEVYQGASVEPIHPPHVRDLSHVHAHPADRAAEGQAYQGVERAHAPQTPEGIKVAEVSHLAARLVTPPVEHVPRPVAELYPTHHPVLDEVGKLVPAEAAGKRLLGFRVGLGHAQQYKAGLASIANGVNPAPLPSDPPITQEHREAASDLHDHLVDMAGVAPGRKDGPVQASVDALAEHVVSLKDGDRSEPEHDVRATQTAEIAAMLPGAVPPAIMQHLPRLVDETTASTLPALPAGRVERVRYPDEDDDVLPLYAGDDKDEEFGALGSGMWLSLAEALDDWGCGHPADGRRREPPPRVCDPRLGSWFGSFGAAPNRPGALDQRYRDEGRQDQRGGRQDQRGGQVVEEMEFLEIVPGRSEEDHLREWDRVHAANLRRWTAERRRRARERERAHFREMLRGDARLGGWGDWRRDRVFLDDVRFRRAYAAATSSPHAVRLLLAGMTVHGYDLPHLQAAAMQRGLALPAALQPDPSLGGVGDDARLGGGHGGGGGGLGGGLGRGRGGYGGGYGGPSYVAPVLGPVCVDPTDPSGPCYDPSLSGVGDSAALAEVDRKLDEHRAATETKVGHLDLDDDGGGHSGGAVRDMAAALRAALAPGGRPLAACSSGCRV